MINNEKPKSIKKVLSAKTNSTNLQYKGEVKVTIKQGSNIVSSRTYHNSGGDTLFEYLLNCICLDASTHGSLEVYRPKFIRLFSNSSAKPTQIGDTSTPLCASIAYNAISNIEDVEDSENLGKQVSMHFTIPGSYITTKTSVYQIGLYCQKYGANENKSRYSAYFNFIDEAGNWAPIDTSSASGDYNLFIE